MSLFAPIGMKIMGGLQLVSLAVIAFLWLNLAAERQHSAKWQQRAKDEIAAHKLTEANVRRVRAEQQAADEAHARKVEQAQTETSQEISREYQEKLAALRARYDALRVRSGSAGPVAGSTSGEDLPGISSTPSGPDAAASDYAFRCEADAIQLMSLQDWIREQLSIPR